MENKQQTEHHSAHGWYDKYHKWMLIVPIVLLILSVIYIYNFNNANGDIIRKDVSLTGGTTISVTDKNIDIDKLKEALKTKLSDFSIRGISDISTGGLQGFSIETSADVNQTRAALEQYLGYKLTNDNSSIEFSGSSLSQGFYKQLRLAIIASFIFMALVVFIIFRTPVPSGAVILCAFADVIMTLTVVDLMGMKLSSAGVIAFLMLIGYSVDTDILLTVRVLRKKEGSVNQRIYDAFKTGLTMTLTAMASVGISLIIIFNFSDALRQIFSVIMIGLVFDILNTWVTNASIIKWYATRKGIQ